MARTALTTPLCLWLLLLAGCAHFSAIEAVPDSYRARLAKHADWLSIAVLDHEAGTFPPSEVSVVKRWRVENEAGRAARLHETQSSSLAGIFDRLHRGEPPLRTIDLDDAIDPVAFLPFRGHAVELAHGFAADDYAFRPLAADRFEILVNGGRLRIAFTPAPFDHGPIRSPTPKEGELGVWTAPFGAESELLEHLQKLVAAEGGKGGTAAAKAGKAEPPALPGIPAAGHYLHHDLRGRLKVVFDRSFPDRYRQAAAHAVARWNEALGYELLEITPGATKIDMGDCVSGPTVCLRWFGAPTLPFTGANGYTALSFDPGTGRIVGGVISVINDDVEMPLKAMAADDRARAAKPDWDWVARAMHRYNDFNTTAHPSPETYIEYLLMHELGHMSGLAHNFFVTGTTTLGKPITSVMSYPPFPVGHLANYLGEADRRRLAMVYRGMPAPSGDYCSTLDAMAPSQGGDGLYHKAPNCDLFVVGDQAEWYIRLAEQGRAGVFTPYPDLSHLSEELRAVYADMAARRRLPPLNVLTKLGFILGDKSPSNAGSRKRITAFLCTQGDRPRIAEQLATFHAVKLQCSR